MRRVLMPVLAGVIGLGLSPALAGPIAITNYSTTGNGAPAPCPQKIGFVFIVTGPNKTAFTYRFVRSDGGTSGVTSAIIGTPPIAGPTVSPIGYTWTLGSKTALPAFKGWVKLEVLTPGATASQPFNFTMKCA
ncbi:MAG TPA: hypothetical protein VGC36_16790 [Rhizomicrobium sp.]